MNLSNWIERNSAWHPDKTAIHFHGKNLSYMELWRRTLEIAACLKQRGECKPGGRVAWLGYNHPDMLALLFACARLGLILTPLNWRLTVAEHRYILQNAEANLLVTDGHFDAHCRQLADEVASLEVAACQSLSALEPWPVDEIRTGDRDPLLLVYTSGTTGRPKGALLSHRALEANAMQSMHMHDMTSADIVHTCLPMFHVGGLNIQTTPALFCGATVVLAERFHPSEYLQDLEKHQPTLSVMVPATIQAILKDSGWSEESLGSLRCMTTGSSIVPLPLIEAVENTGIPVLQVYGSTETCPIAVYHRLAEFGRRHSNTGRSGILSALCIINAEGGEVAAGERGEVLIKGDHILNEYWRDPSATGEAFSDRWFRTGDIGHVDETGCLVIDDRAKDIIISGGENIYPAEIERVLYEYPGVREAAVVAGPDARWGEVAIAYIIAEDELSIDALEQHCRTQLAKFKLPHQYRLVDDLPRNSIGKVLKYKLREALESC